MLLKSWNCFIFWHFRTGLLLVKGLGMFVCFWFKHFLHSMHTVYCRNSIPNIARMLANVITDKNMAEITKRKRSSQCKFKTCPRKILWWRHWAPNEKSRLIWRYTSLISLFFDFSYDLHDITHHWTSLWVHVWSHRWYDCSYFALHNNAEWMHTHISQTKHQWLHFYIIWRQAQGQQ